MKSAKPIPRVSVVVPIYGVEKHLRQCIDSILAQSLRDIEVILVNDGSPDGCAAIIDEYAEKDDRIIAVHQANRGYGGAVNHGIEIATGKYIGIIEPDDWIEPTMYEKLYWNAIKNQSDVVKCLFYVYDSTAPGGPVDAQWNQDISSAPDTVFTILDYPNLYTFHASVWAALYRTPFIKRQRMVETKSASYQDFPFMTETMCRAKRMTIVKECLVHYRMESGQESSTLRRDKRLLMMPEQFCRGREILQKYDRYRQLREEFYFHACCTNHGLYNTIYHKHKWEYYKKLRQLFAPLKDDPDFTFKYFTPWQREFVQKILDNRFLATVFSNANMKSVRRFLLSGHVKSKYMRLQVLGVAVSIGTSPPRYPCLVEFSIRLGGR